MDFQNGIAILHLAEQKDASAFRVITVHKFLIPIIDLAVNAIPLYIGPNICCYMYKGQR